MIATLIGLLILTALLYDITRLFGSDEPRRPPLASLRGWRAALEGVDDEEPSACLREICRTLG
ncbi:hypothetical protein ACWEWI_37235 [Streptomyces sp. NPDC003753]